MGTLLSAVSCRTTGDGSFGTGDDLNSVNNFTEVNSYLCNKMVTLLHRQAKPSAYAVKNGVRPDDRGRMAQVVLDGLYVLRQHFVGGCLFRRSRLDLKINGDISSKCIDSLHLQDGDFLHVTA